MQFSQYAALVGLLGSVVQASPAAQYSPLAVRSEELEVRSDDGTCSYDVKNSWTDAILYNDIVQADVHLGLALAEAHLEGSVDVSFDLDFLVSPVVKVDLGGLKAYLEVGLGATASLESWVNLCENLGLTVILPGLDLNVQVGIALDLVLSVSAAIDLDLALSVEFPEGCYMRVNTLTQEIVDSYGMEGLIVTHKPLSIGADVSLDVDIDLDVALRLRTIAAICAEVDLGLPNIINLHPGANADVAIYVNLFDYHTTFSHSSSGSGCSANEYYLLTAAVAVDVNVLGVLNLDLHPNAYVTLSTGPSALIDVSIGEGSSHHWDW